MDYKAVYRMNPSYGTESIGDILEMRFFVDKRRRLERIYLIERNGRKVLWLGYDSDARGAFTKYTDEELIDIFKKLALGNPEDFRALYKDIKGGSKRVFRCIEEARVQVKELFNFT